MRRPAFDAKDAPAAVGGYAQVVKISEPQRLVFVSDQIPARAAGEVPEDFTAQARLAWRNLERQLAAADMTFDNLVKVTTFLSDRRSAEANAEARREALGERTPALTVIVAGIFDERWLLEIEAVAAA